MEGAERVVTPCPLCGHEAEERRWADMHGRKLLRCPCCHLVYAAPDDLPAPEAERGRYLLHRNTPEDAGYVRFLRRLWEPVKELLPRPWPAGARLLDYGSGPEPVMAGLIRAEGFPCDIYDPFFAPELPSHAPYMAILACEVVEHFHAPLKSWRHICSLLATGGVLGVMTSLAPETPEEFSRWSYAGDFTHVAFYSEETLRWVAEELGLRSLGSPEKGVQLFEEGGRGVG